MDLRAKVVSEINDTDPNQDVEEPENGGRWLRALLVLLFAFIYQISEVVFGAVALFQVICMLLTGDRNERLNEFAGTLTRYMFGVLQYVCLRTDDQPWPLGEPGNEPD
jgi:hypothetical protein